MAVLADLTEEEKYFYALLQDQSGIDQAEFSWTDETSPDFVFRCWDFQYPWYRTRAKMQIDQCVARGELVLTRRGHVPIEQVAIGDEVWTHRNRWRKVTYVWDKGDQSVVRVTNPGNPSGLLVTPDHKMWARTGTRKMVAGKRSIHLDQPAWLPPQDFSERQGEQRATLVSSPYLFSPEAIPEVERLLNCAWKTIPPLSADLMWIAGLFVAEGYVRASGSETVISVHVDEVDMVLKMAHLAGIDARPNPATDSVQQVIFPGRSLAAWFTSHFGKLAHGKRLPSWALGMHPDYRTSLLEGLVFGDGHTRGSRRDSEREVSEYTTVSRALAYDVRLLIQSLGRGSSVSLSRKAGTMVIEGREVASRDTYCVAMWVSDALKSREVARDELIWAAHYGVEPAGTARVYDIEVEEDHSFVVNGQVVSNCARAIGKSVGIQMRAWAFAFTNPGEEMLITAPEMIHLDPVTKNIEDRIMSARLSREFLKKSGVSNGIKHRPFEVSFRNGATIKGRIPQKDGRGVKGSVAAGALVTTPIGHLPVEKINEGDLVLTHEGRFMPVLKIHSYESETVLVAGAGHRGIQVSGNHRFYARRNANPQRTRNLSVASWVVVDDEEISQRYYWATPTSLPEMPRPDLPLDVDEHLFFWLVGRYVADGNLSGTNKRGARTQISYTAHIDRLPEIESVAALAGIKTARRAHDNAGCVTINSTALATWLACEFGQHADGKRIPIWLHGQPQSLQESFLDGYLTGDGNHNLERARWEMGTASKELAIGLRLMGQMLEKTTSFSWVDPKPNQVCDAPLRSWRVHMSERGNGLFEGDHLWQRIRKVEPAGIAMVYDLVVAEDFSYVADGLVHKGSSELEGW